MKFKMVFIPLVAIALLLGFYQNCSKSNGNVLPEAVFGDKFDGTNVKIVNAEVGDDVNLTLLPADIELLTGASISCQWSYKNDDGQISPLPGSDQNLLLDDIALTDKGRYLVECTDSVYAISVVFIVYVTEPGPTDEKGLLKIFFIQGGDTTLAQEHADLTEVAALAKCKDVADDNKDKGILCKWKGKTIHEVPAPDLKKDFDFISIISGKETKTTVKNLTLAKAEDKCTDLSAKLLKATPKAGYKCLWDDKVFKKKAEGDDDAKKVFKYIRTENAKQTVVHNKELTRAASVKLCKDTDTDPDVGAKCLWGSEVLLDRAEPLKIYKGYFVVDKDEKLFITTKDITKFAALENCKKNANENPKKGIKCTWGDKVIFQRSPPSDKKDFHFTSIEGGKSSKSTVKDLTKMQAEAKCDELVAALMKKNDKAGYRCEWGSEVLKKRDEVIAKKANYVFTSIENNVPTVITEAMVLEAAAKSKCEAHVKALLARNKNAGYKCAWDGTVFKQKAEVRDPKDTFRGYYIVSGNLVQFAEVPDIKRGEAVTQCKEKAEAKPNNGVRCLWGTELIFSRVEPEKRDLKLFLVDDGKSELRQEKPNMTRSDARDFCKDAGLAFPLKGVKCKWGDEVIFEKAQPAKKAVLRGFYIIDDKADELFLTIQEITKEDGIKACKDKAKADHPKRKFRCMWDGNAVFKNF